MKTKVYSREYKEVFQAAKSALRKEGFVVKESSLKERYIIALKDASFWSYGERVEVNFKRLTGKTKVSVHSFSKGIQLIDWGKNDENETSIINALTKKLR